MHSDNLRTAHDGKDSKVNLKNTSSINISLIERAHMTYGYMDAVKMHSTPSPLLDQSVVW